MNTPICDFARTYAAEEALRLHMPGHKGVGALGIEALDITEIDGADSLYEARGIIRESEQNASQLFGCPSFYSTEGSSLSIRAMLYLAMQQRQGTSKRVWAGRNAHKTFLSAVALLDLEVEWLYSEEDASYLHCAISAPSLDTALESAREKPFAVYITSPDYLGGMADIASLASVCHRHGVLLLVDGAHGAYLRFLPTSLHPIDLGADMCCASAHKTLNVLTGGAYLHISTALPESYARQAKNALALFGSTSPSYLILQSLDAANRALADGYSERLRIFRDAIADLKRELAERGFCLYGSEPMKLTIEAKSLGYSGTELAERLRGEGIVVEFADPDFVVMMFTPEIGLSGIARLRNALLRLETRSAISIAPPVFAPAERVMNVRRALFSQSECVSIEKSLGKVLSAATVGCPPAVPIVICGERIDAHAIECFKYYGIESCWIVKDAESSADTGGKDEDF